MKVIAKKHFLANGVEGFPGKELSSEEIYKIESVGEELVKDGLVELVPEEHEKPVVPESPAAPTPPPVTESPSDPNEVEAPPKEEEPAAEEPKSPKSKNKNK